MSRCHGRRYTSHVDRVTPVTNPSSGGTRQLVHDLNNALAAIRGYGELIRYGLQDGAPAACHVQALLAAADEATAIVREMRIEANAADVTRSTPS